MHPSLICFIRSTSFESLGSSVLWMYQTGLDHSAHLNRMRIPQYRRNAAKNDLFPASEDPQPHGIYLRIQSSHRARLTGCNSGSACQSTVSIVQRRIAQVWDISKILDITTGFGQLNLGAAKAIDIGIAYYTFCKALICVIETHEASCDIYAAAAFSTGSLGGALTLLQHSMFGPTSKSLFARYLILAMVLTGLCTLALPTVISASTSYGARSRGRIKYGEDWVSFESWRPSFAVVTDGSRVGLRDGYIIPQGGYANDKALMDCEFCIVSLSDIDYYAFISKDEIGPFAEKSTAFPLNTTAYSADHTNPIYQIEDRASSIRLDGKLWNLDRLSLNIVPLPRKPWFYKDLVDSPENLVSLDMARCDATDQYQWGFSFLILFMFSIVNACAAAILYAIHLLTIFRNHVIRLGRHEPHVWRAVADLSVALGKITGGEHPRMDTSRLKEIMKGSSIMLSAESTATNDRVCSSSSQRGLGIEPTHRSVRRMHTKLVVSGASTSKLIMTVRSASRRSLCHS
ncbi:uncharacterized protein MYCFIDRAFT_174753 [Pseudocercospora fijiensis CIRAD86]|uniref:Uncharacterized protein n=1 Tax=Pseudocercospora fijiensis (strain CIRAD86) TaxID=383855 RepID=M3B1Q8_PSEFD|nr:uncharacterized protein MYCFIDRAFT_174753 [Pseudocercospora fijiensis CIRAD86]EME83288.1 hypothetical protein MYCFIDRAFT_174753 [Pseudocercospora fijiensis CIRAD86]